MAIHSLGKVTIASAGTPQRITANETDPSVRYPAKAFMVQAWHANTGKVWVGSSSLDRTTGVGVQAVLPIPTVNTLPTFSATNEQAPAAFNLADVYVDVDVGGEAVIISVVR